MTRVLIVEDEPAVQDVVEHALSRSGMRCERAASLSEARAALARGAVDLLVLDLGLPDGDGLSLCRELRGHSATPILVLTCRDEEADLVIGLETGADDYLVKPFSPRELVARARSLLRRASVRDAASAALVFGRVRLDPSAHRVSLGEREISLTRTEFELLHTILARPSHVHSREALIADAYAGEVFVSGRTIDSHVKNIRRRFAQLEASADPIETVYGVGYRARSIA